MYTFVALNGSQDATHRARSDPTQTHGVETKRVLQSRTGVVNIAKLRDLTPDQQ
jgi:hypothetical protein